jgi:EVE domain
MTAWLGVVSRAHVQRGVAGSFAQLCHGKAQPLRRMHRGDWLVYYSPTIDIGGDALRAFTAIGQVEGAEVYPYDMGGGFVPYRRNVRYVDTKEVALDMIKQKLEFCARPNWGMALRRGHLPLEAADFATIAAAMGARQPEGFGVGLE